MSALLDAQLHFWDPAARHHDWLGACARLQRRFGDIRPCGAAPETVRSADASSAVRR